MIRHLRRWGLLAVGIGALIYGALFVSVLLVSRQDQRRRVDAIVVLGAAQYNGRPSAVLKARLDHALTLYRAGLAPIIVVTGGIGTGDTQSEATVGQRYLVSQEVPNMAVVVRPEGRTTMTSMTSVSEWASDQNVSSILLVSDPFHLLRLRLEARRVHLKAYTSPTATSPISVHLQQELRYVSAEALKIPVVWFRSLVHSDPPPR